MKLSQKQQGHLIMLVVMIIFGLNIPVIKDLYNTEMISPFALVTLRMSFGALAFWIISFFLPKEKVERKDLIILFIGGLCGMLLNQGLFAYGLGKASPVDASIITTSSPLFALIIAAIILKEPITIKKAGGVLVGILGAVFLVYSSHYDTQQNPSLEGDLAVLGAQLFYSFYLVITRPLSKKYSPITLMKWMFLISAMIALPTFFNNVKEAPIFHQATVQPYVSLMFVLVGATCVTYVMIPLAQQRIRPTTISMYNNVQPLVASTVAIIAGQDKFTINKLIAAIIIFIGVYLVTTSKSRKDIEEVGTENSN